MSACVLLSVTAIIFRKQLIEERCIPMGEAGLASYETNLN